MDSIPSDTNDLNIGICCFSTEQATTLQVKSITGKEQRLVCLESGMCPSRLTCKSLCFCFSELTR